ncbi:hypothetical protein AC1031_002141 [Aphanomyces cochlioides]|nr:hypothetical protein AC1031_002141 [Aphanomyces cochlioides]
MYEEPSRVVVVSTTIAENNHGVQCLREAEDEIHGWCVFSAHPEDDKKTAITSVREINITRLLEQVTASTDDVITELTRNCKTLTSGEDEDTSRSFLHPFYERSRRLRLPVAQAVKRAILSTMNAARDGEGDRLAAFQSHSCNHG